MLNELSELIKSSLQRTFPAKSTLLFQGEVPRSAMVLKTGTVRVFGISDRGDTQVVTYHIPGEFFPAAWIFGKSNSTLFYYEAIEQCEVALVQRAKLIEYMMSSSERTNAMLDYFTSNYAASLIRINGLEQPKAREKLLFTLYYLCQRYGKKSGNTYTIPLALTHQEFANMVGLTRETTATEMNQLKKDGAVEYNNQHYQVRMAKVLELIGEDTFGDVFIGL